MNGIWSAPGGSEFDSTERNRLAHLPRYPTVVSPVCDTTALRVYPLRAHLALPALLDDNSEEAVVGSRYERVTGHAIRDGDIRSEHVCGRLQASQTSPIDAHHAAKNR